MPWSSWAPRNQIAVVKHSCRSKGFRHTEKLRVQTNGRNMTNISTVKLSPNMLLCCGFSVHWNTAATSSFVVICKRIFHIDRCFWFLRVLCLSNVFSVKKRRFCGDHTRFFRRLQIATVNILRAYGSLAWPQWFCQVVSKDEKKSSSNFFYYLIYCSDCSYMRALC